MPKMKMSKSPPVLDRIIGLEFYSYPRNQHGEAVPTLDKTVKVWAQLRNFALGTEQFAEGFPLQVGIRASGWIVRYREDLIGGVVDQNGTYLIGGGLGVFLQDFDRGFVYPLNRVDELSPPDFPRRRYLLIQVGASN